MLSDGIVESSQSAWSSPSLSVPKKLDASGSKKWRGVIDYLKLNYNIQDDKFPLPNINEILDSFSGAIYFTHLDLFQGFFLISLKKKAADLTQRSLQVIISIR